MLCITSVIVGILSVLTQITIPLAAELSNPKNEKRTRKVRVDGRRRIEIIERIEKERKRERDRTRKISI